jgi:hypothetical protein
MRPVLRGPSPQTMDFNDYDKASTPLKGILGQYCSYCERHIPTNLAVEHIQPKGFTRSDGTIPYKHLEGRWTNFLLACVNCNSTKGDTDIDITVLVLPDRDNTFAAFVYTADGRISPAIGAPPGAAAMIQLTGIDKRVRTTRDKNGKVIAEDRSSQRMERWGIAVRQKTLWDRHPTLALQEVILRDALDSGFFSIWMKAFESDPVMRQCFIDAFPGTAYDCFNSITTAPISPRPTDGLGLSHAGKI